MVFKLYSNVREVAPAPGLLAFEPSAAYDSKSFRFGDRYANGWRGFYEARGLAGREEGEFVFNDLGGGAYSLSRTVIRSTNAGALVDFAAGSVDISVTNIAPDDLSAVQLNRLLGAYGGDDRRLISHLQAMDSAKAIGTARLYGLAGNLFADSFSTLTRVNTGGATNLDSSVSGRLKPAIGFTAQTIGSPSTTADFSTGFTNINRATALTAADVISKIGVYNNQGAKTLTVKILQRTVAGTYTVVVSESFAHPGGGWSDKTLTSAYTVPGSGTYYIGVYQVGTGDATSSVSRAFKAGDVTGSGQSGFTEDSGSNAPTRVQKNPTSLDLTVSSTSITAAAAPSIAAVSARVVETDAITLNADLVFAVSRDGGTTYTTCTMTKLYTDLDGFAVYWSGDIDISAQPSGTSMRWRATSANGKAFELRAVAMRWG